MQALEGDEDTPAGKEELIFKHLLGVAGLHFSRISGAHTGGPLTLIESTTIQMQQMLQDKLAEDEGVLNSFLIGMRSYLQVRPAPRRECPPHVPSSHDAGAERSRDFGSSCR